MKYPIAVLLFCLACQFPATAQQNMTLYQLHDIVQSNSLNPAVPATCKWTIGFPGLGSISTAIATPTTYNKLGAGQDVLDANKLLSELKSTVAMSNNTSINLLMIGYRAPSTYWQFTVNERVSALGTVPKDLLQVAFQGNAPFVGKVMSGNVSANALHYREYALSVSHDFGEGMWAGIRPKLLFGRMSIKSTSNKLSLFTEPTTYDLTLTSDMLIRASMPGKPVIDPVLGTVTDFDADVQAQDFIFNPSNIGVGADIGMSKLMQSGWKVSASLLNLGMIKWSKNTHAFRQQKTIKYTGPTSSIDSWSRLADTLKGVIRPNYSQESYSQMLSPVAMFGISYPIVEKLRLGVTGMTEFQPSYTPWALTATVFTEGTSILTAGVSYTITPTSTVNVGVAAGLHLGAFNIHFITDNIVAALSPFNQSYATLQMGINFRFGCGGSSGGKSDEIPCAAYKGVVTKTKRDCVPCSKADKKGRR